VVALARPDGPLNLAQAHEQLETLLASQYDAAAWGKLLDAVQPEGTEAAQMTVDEAFHRYGTDAGVQDRHAKSMEDYRNIAKTFL
jgi:hypothetical protein